MRYRILESILFVTALSAVSTAQVVDLTLANALAIRADDARVAVQELRLPYALPSTFQVRVRLGARVHVLELYEYDVRSSDFELLVTDGEKSGRVRAVPKAVSVTYRGTVQGVPDSVVAASLIDGSLSALIRLDPARAWVVQPARDLDRRYSNDVHLVFPTAANRPIPGWCGVPDTVRAAQRRATGPRPQATVLAQLAVDADFDYYKRNGSSTTMTQNRITTILNAVDAIYKRDVDITLKLTSILIRTSATYVQTDPQALLPEFQQRWNQSHTAVPRDLVHLFTGKGSFTGVLGLGVLGSVCNRQDAYAVSKAYHANLSMNVGLVAHQIAHNFDALHCDTSTPCNLMCSRFGGCSANLASFGAASKAAIIKFRDTRSCLGSASPPQIQSIAPTQVKAFAAARLTITGLRMREVNEVRLGSLRLGPNAFSTTDTTVSVALPRPVTVGTLPLSVVSPAGPSNTTSFTILETRPAELAVAGLVFSSSPLLFEFGAGAKATWILIVAPNNQTFRFMGADVLRNFLPLAVGTLDAAGLGSFVATPPSGLKGTIWSQLVTYQSSRFDGVSILRSTLFL